MAKDRRKPELRGTLTHVAKNRKKSELRGTLTHMFLLRFPEKLRTRIAQVAAKNNRSVTAEVIDRLEKSMSDPGVANHTRVLSDTGVLLDPAAMEKLSEWFGRIDDRLEELQQNLEMRGVVSKNK